MIRRWSRCLALALAVVASACAPPGAWRVSHPEPDPDSVSASFADVSCVDAVCLALGPHGGDPEGIGAARWDGRAWSRLPRVPLPALDSPVYQVKRPRIDCANPTACAVVATIVTSRWPPVPVAATWDGTTWTVSVAPPAPQGANNPQWDDVACATPDWCLAIGHRVSAQGLHERFAERWDGRAWTPAPAPIDEQGLYQFSFQTRLSCVAPTFCAFLTGALFPTLTTATSVQRWDGRAWARVPLPPGFDATGVLYDIDCTAATACVAVGWRWGGGFAVRWDGASWSVEPGGGVVLPLSAVSCAGASCLAVAGPSPSGDGRVNPITGLARIGGVWRPTSAPDLREAPGALGVSCAAPSCLVVGDRFADSRKQPLALTFAFGTGDG
jgi:hypothetical protein